METTEKKTIWDLLENPPTHSEGVANLVEWSMNYDWKSRPYLIFLDLIGYSDEHYGEKMIDPKNWNLGYLELSYLADALEEYAINPQAVSKFIDDLTEAEDNE